MGPNSVKHWYDVPRTRRKEYEKNLRITRNEVRHEEANKKKEQVKHEPKVA